MDCHVCLGSYAEYPGHGKLCAPCREEIDVQHRRMVARGDFEDSSIDLRPWRAYLAAFDAYLRGDVQARVAMTRELSALYRRRGIWPPAHRPDLSPEFSAA